MKPLTRKETKDARGEQSEIMWDIPIRTWGNNISDTVTLDNQKKTNISSLLNVSCLFDTQIAHKEKKKPKTYKDVKYGILKAWERRTKKLITVPVITGALGCYINKYVHLFLY